MATIYSQSVRIRESLETVSGYIDDMQHLAAHMEHGSAVTLGSRLDFHIGRTLAPIYANWCVSSMLEGTRQILER